MLREYRENDIDKIMQIWRDGNYRAHNFIPNKYWSDNYSKVQNEYLRKSETWVYEENGEIQGFISIMQDGYIGAIFVVPKAQRDGVGTLLMNNAKLHYDKLYLNVFEKNVGATLFYKTMEFKKVKSQIDEATQEKEYIMEWKKYDTEKISVIYFDNSINDEVIEEFAEDDIVELNCMHIYNGNPVKGINNIDLRGIIDKTPAGMIVKDHIALLAAFSKAIIKDKAVIYINNTFNYDMIEDILKDYIRVKKLNVLIVIQKPFLIEGIKKIKQCELLEQKYKMYPMYKCDYNEQGAKLSFKEAFSKRDEECLKEIKEICKKFNGLKESIQK